MCIPEAERTLSQIYTGSKLRLGEPDTPCIKDAISDIYGKEAETW